MKPYICTRIQEHLELALLEGSALPTPLQAHLTGCPSCAAEAASLQTLISALQASPAPVVPADLTARIVPLVLAAAQTSRRQGVIARLARPVVAFATAFGIVVASLAAAGGALVVSAALTAGSRTPTPATSTPQTEAQPSTTPESTPTPAATPTPPPAAPASGDLTPSPSPLPTELPRRTPEPSPAPTATPAPSVEITPEPSTGGSVTP